MLLLHGPKKTVTTVLFTPDGGSLITASSDLKVRLWDLAAGEVRHTLDRDPSHYERAVALSPDGALVATGDRGGVRLWDVRTGRPVRKLAATNEFSFATAVAFTPDGKQLVAGHDPDGAELDAWDVATGSRRPPPAQPPGTALRLAFDARGRRLAIQGFTTMSLWDVARGRELLSTPEEVRLGTAVLTFSPDGRILAFGAGPTLRLWDMKALAEVGRLELPRKHFQSAAFSPDGRYLATVSNEESVKVWDAADGQLHQTFAWGAGKLKCVAFAADGLRAAAGGEQGQVVVWDVDG